MKPAVADPAGPVPTDDGPSCPDGGTCHHSCWPATGCFRQPASKPAPAPGENTKHVPITHGPDYHVDGGEVTCMFCDGGLYGCDRCGLLEGSLTTHCPGAQVPDSVSSATYAGDLDYRSGRWVIAPSPHSPAGLRIAAGIRDDRAPARGWLARIPAGHALDCLTAYGLDNCTCGAARR